MDNQDSVSYCGIIKEIKYLDGCDNIMWAKVNDWGTIVKKDGYKVGDKVGIAVTDAVLPEAMITRLNIKNYLRKGTRVKTVKLKGVFSECLVFDIDSNYKEGQDLMKDFDIVKYEEPEQQIAINNPKVYFDSSNIFKYQMWRKWIKYHYYRLKKTVKYQRNINFNVYFKFPNFKNVPSIFNENDDVVISRKIHGTNARYGIVKKNKLKFWSKQKYEFVYGSHRVEKGSSSRGFYSQDVWRIIENKYNIKVKLEKLIEIYGEPGTGIILYGEIYGAGIQGEKYNYGLQDVKLACFDIEINNEYLDHYDFVTLTDEVLLDRVPHLYQGKYSKEVCDKLLDANIFGTKIPEEGIVIKCPTGNRHKIAKMISPAYHIFADKNNITDFH